MIIYKITNLINGKMYIGCTSQSLIRRWKQHLNPNNKRTNIVLRKALDIYGRGNFIIDILEKVNSRKEQFEKEIFWIAFFESNKSHIGYNMTSGGDTGPIRYGKDNPNFGKPSTNPRWQEIIYRDRVGKMTEEHKQKFCMSNVGKHKSEAHKKSLSDSHKEFYTKNKYTQEAKDKISAAKKGTISPRRTLILCLNNYKVYDHYQEAAKALGVSAGNIPQVVNGIYSHTKGYKFVKVTEEHLIF